MERTITVRGVGNISAKPDFIVIEMDIRGQSKNYSEALADASSAVEAVCNAAVSAGHSKDALKTINFGVSSEYDSVRNSKGTINAFLSDTIVRTTLACRSILTGICLKEH